MRCTFGICLLALTVLGTATGWAADDAGWRLELSGGPTVAGGSHQHRDGDYMIKTIAEYEMPVCPHLTLGLRLLPAFVYEQKEGGDSSVWGAGVGVAARGYLSRDSYQGLFGELGAHAIGHEGRFVDNGSNLNFLLDAGVGWQFNCGLFLVTRFEHISNANITHHNGATNLVTLGLGYRF